MDSSSSAPPAKKARESDTFSSLKGETNFLTSFIAENEAKNNVSFADDDEEFDFLDATGETVELQVKNTITIIRCLFDSL